MKKCTLVFVALIMNGMAWAQNCTDLFISEYVEGWNNNKALEIYNPTSQAITLTSTYRLIRWSNGSTIADQDIQYVLPLEGEIQPYQVIVLIQDTNFPGQDTMIWAGLRAKGTYLAPADYNAGTQGCRVVFWNGDDAVSLQKFVGSEWKDIDIFAEIGVRPLNWQGETSPAGAWTDTPPYWRGEGAYLTQNQSLVRKPSVEHGVDRATMATYGQTQTGGYPNSFNALLEYDSLPANFFDSLGFHTCSCKPLGVPQHQDDPFLTISPNPVQGNRITLRSAESVTRIEITDLTGRSLLLMSLGIPKQEVVLTLPETAGSGLILLNVTTTSNRVITRKVILL